MFVKNGGLRLFWQPSHFVNTVAYSLQLWTGNGGFETSHYCEDLGENFPQPRRLAGIVPLN
jgi:hypothetical protein